jgi:molybdate transport system substrate-binding protein
VSDRVSTMRFGRRSLLRLATLLAAWALLLGSVPAGIAQPAPAPPLRIAAAADLEPLLPALLKAFEQQTGMHGEASFASSATLASHIENGAPFDVFLSADMMLPQRIVQDGLATAGATASPYARGALVLWARNGAAGTPALSMQLLASAQIKSVAIANPEHAPYGRAALQALTSLGLLGAVQPKLRTAENIAQAAQFASTGNADAGLISLTSALKLKAVGHYVPVPQSAYAPILQGAVALRHGANASGAGAFLAFLHSPAAQQQLQQSGLEPAR